MNLISTVTGDWAIFDCEPAENLCGFLCKKVNSDPNQVLIGIRQNDMDQRPDPDPDQQETTFNISPYIFRLVWKADILMGQVKDQFPPPAEIDANSVLKGHTVDR